MHCRVAPVNRPRGLCWRCYHVPGVKEQYPICSAFARRGVGLFAGRGKTPRPTTAAPGTKEKLAVLAARAAAGEELFHPNDCSTLDGHAVAAQMIRFIEMRDTHL
jgi:hypothetical protein